MAKYAVLDIGTNSVKFFVTEIIGNNMKTIIDSANISRLGRDFAKSGTISPDAVTENINVLKNFVRKAEAHNVDELFALGTMCLRSASNADIFIDKVKNELGLCIDVISGEEEARLSYCASFIDTNTYESDIAVVDIGGGSTEIILGNENRIAHSISFNIGGVTITDMFLRNVPNENSDLEKASKYIEEKITQDKLEFKPQNIIGIGGAVTTMGAIKNKLEKYDPNIIHNSILSTTEIENQIEFIKSKTIEERKKIVGLHPKRADVILAGACILQVITNVFNVPFITISDKGLRHGFIFDRFINN